MPSVQGALGALGALGGGPEVGLNPFQELGGAVETTGRATAVDPVDPDPFNSRSRRHNQPGRSA